MVVVIGQKQFHHRIILHLDRIAKAILFRCSHAERLNLLSFTNSNSESTPKSPINWILSEVEECNYLLMRTLRLRSVSLLDFAQCPVLIKISLFGVDSTVEV